jgi:hypothetical protein
MPSSIWKLLLEMQHAFFGLPAARRPRRHDPQERLAIAAALAAHDRVLVGDPVVHVEGVGDDARARPHLQDRRPQLQVQMALDEQRQHRGLRKIGGKEIALHEARLVRDAFLFGVALRKGHELVVIFDAERLHAALRRRDHRDAVARAEIDHEVVGLKPRHVEHVLDECGLRRQPDDVLALLHEFGPVAVVRGRRGREREAGKQSGEGGRAHAELR